MTLLPILGNTNLLLSVGREGLTHLSEKERSTLNSLARTARQLGEKIASGPGLWDRIKAFFSENHRKTLADRTVNWHENAADTVSRIHLFLTVNRQRAEVSRLGRGSNSDNIDGMVLTPEERRSLRDLLKTPDTVNPAAVGDVKTRIDRLTAAHFQREAIAKRVGTIVSGVAVAGKTDRLAMVPLPELSAAYRSGRDTALKELRQELFTQLKSHSPEGLRQALASGAKSRLEQVALAKLLIELKPKPERERATKADPEPERKEDQPTNGVERQAVDSSELLEFLEEPVLPSGSLDHAAGWYRYLSVSHSPADALRIAAESGSADSLVPWAFLAADAVPKEDAERITAEATNFEVMVRDNVSDCGRASWRDLLRHDYLTVSPRDRLKCKIENDIEKLEKVMSSANGLTEGEKGIADLLRKAFDSARGAFDNEDGAFDFNILFPDAPQIQAPTDRFNPLYQRRLTVAGEQAHWEKKRAEA